MNTFPTYSNRNTTRISKFGRGGVTLRSTLPLTAEQIRNAVPSIYADDKHCSRSEKYQFISTGAVLEGLRKEGFEPFEIRQGGSKDQEKRGFTKHLIRLRHAGQAMQVGDHVREIVLVNSHDGTSSYQMMGGVFRMVCSNGMVVAEGTLEEVRVPHKGDVIHAVLDGCVQVLGQLPQVSERIQDWQNLQLTQPERLAFAKAALALRFDAAEKLPDIRPDRLLMTNRREDASQDLWRTFNIVQENAVNGGVRYTSTAANGRQRNMRTKEVRSVDGNVALNRALWVLAEEMRALKG